MQPLLSSDRLSRYILNQVTYSILRTERRQIAQIAGRPPLLSPSSSTIELPTLEQHVASPVLEKQPDIVLSLNNVHFGWKDSLPDKPRLSLTLRSSPNGNLVMIVGPVGSGKSTFLRGLAGETPVLEGELFMKYPDLAFCEQASWLTNTSIRESIIGENLSFLFDSEWYHTVVRACGLEPDLKRLPAGDQTLVGSKGAKLSGGQKQRIVSRIFLYVLSSYEWNTYSLISTVGYSASRLCAKAYCLLRRCPQWSRQWNSSSGIQQCFRSGWITTPAGLHCVLGYPQRYVFIPYFLKHLS